MSYIGKTRRVVRRPLPDEQEAEPLIAAPSEPIPVPDWPKPEEAPIQVPNWPAPVEVPKQS